MTERKPVFFYVLIIAGVALPLCTHFFFDMNIAAAQGSDTTSCEGYGEWAQNYRAANPGKTVPERTCQVEVPCGTGAGIPGPYVAGAALAIETTKGYVIGKCTEADVCKGQTICGKDPQLPTTEIDQTGNGTKPSGGELPSGEGSTGGQPESGGSQPGTGQKLPESDQIGGAFKEGTDGKAGAGGGGEYRPAGSDVSNTGTDPNTGRLQGTGNFYFEKIDPNSLGSGGTDLGQDPQGIGSGSKSSGRGGIGSDSILDRFTNRNSGSTFGNSPSSGAGGATGGLGGVLGGIGNAIAGGFQQFMGALGSIFDLFSSLANLGGGGGGATRPSGGQGGVRPLPNQGAQQSGQQGQNPNQQNPNQGGNQTIPPTDLQKAIEEAIKNGKLPNLAGTPMLPQRLPSNQPNTVPPRQQDARLQQVLDALAKAQPQQPNEKPSSQQEPQGRNQNTTPEPQKRSVAGPDLTPDPNIEVDPSKPLPSPQLQIAQFTGDSACEGAYCIDYEAIDCSGAQCIVPVLQRLAQNVGDGLGSVWRELFGSKASLAAVPNKPDPGQAKTVQPKQPTPRDNSMGVAPRTLPVKDRVLARTTFYGPGGGGTEDGDRAARANLEGTKNKKGEPLPVTLDQLRTGKSGYVTVATAPENLGKFYSLGPVTYTSPIDGKTYTGDKALADASNGKIEYSPNLDGAIAFAHDTGDAFRAETCATYGTCDTRLNKFDLPVGRFGDGAINPITEKPWTAAEVREFLKQPYSRNNTWYEVDATDARIEIASRGPQSEAVETASSFVEPFDTRIDVAKGPLGEPLLNFDCKECLEKSLAERIQHAENIRLSKEAIDFDKSALERLKVSNLTDEQVRAMAESYTRVTGAGVAQSQTLGDSPLNTPTGPLAVSESVLAPVEDPGLKVVLENTESGAVQASASGGLGALAQRGAIAVAATWESWFGGGGEPAEGEMSNLEGVMETEGFVNVDRTPTETGTEPSESTTEPSGEAPTETPSEKPNAGPEQTEVASDGSQKPLSDEERARLEKELEVAKEQEFGTKERLNDTKEVAGAKAAAENNLKKSEDARKAIAKAEDKIAAERNAVRTVNTEPIKDLADSPLATQAERDKLEQLAQGIDSKSAQIKNALNAPMGYVGAHPELGIDSPEAFEKHLTQLANQQASAAREAIGIGNKIIERTGPINELEVEAAEAATIRSQIASKLGTPAPTPSGTTFVAVSDKWISEQMGDYATPMGYTSRAYGDEYTPALGPVADAGEGSGQSAFQPIAGVFADPTGVGSMIRSGLGAAYEGIGTAYNYAYDSIFGDVTGDTNELPDLGESTIPDDVAMDIGVDPEPRPAPDLGVVDPMNPPQEPAIAPNLGVVDPMNPDDSSITETKNAPAQKGWWETVKGWGSSVSASIFAPTPTANIPDDVAMGIGADPEPRPAPDLGVVDPMNPDDSSIGSSQGSGLKPIPLPGPLFTGEFPTAPSQAPNLGVDSPAFDPNDGRPMETPSAPTEAAPSRTPSTPTEAAPRPTGGTSERPSGGGNPAPTSGSGLSGLGSNIASSLGNFLKALAPILPNLWNMLFGPEQQKPPAPPIPSVKLTANPATVAMGTSSRLSWSGENLANCTVFGPGSSKLTSGGGSGVISTPKLTTSTEFGIACSGSRGNSLTTAVVTVKVEGATGTPIPVEFPAGIAEGTYLTPELQQYLQNGGAGAGGQSLLPGAGGSNEAPVTPTESGHDADGNEIGAWCDPNLPIDAFIQCLCKLQPGGCQPWQQTRL